MAFNFLYITLLSRVLWWLWHHREPCDPRVGCGVSSLSITPPHLHARPHWGAGTAAGPSAGLLTALCPVLLTIKQGTETEPAL